MNETSGGERRKKNDKKNSRCQSEELARLPETEGYTRLKMAKINVF